MNQRSPKPIPLHPSELIALFGEEKSYFRGINPIDDTEEAPRDAVALLVHNNHMTDAMEGFHGAAVRVSVVAVDQQPDSYARMSLLTRESDDRIVQLGIVRLCWQWIPVAVRSEIEREKTPLGRILSDLNVLRSVQFESLWKFEPTPLVTDLVHLPSAATMYGRTARILVHDSPAIELLEIVV